MINITRKCYSVIMFLLGEYNLLLTGQLGQMQMQKHLAG